jgi:hypothetical protein
MDVMVGVKEHVGTSPCQTGNDREADVAKPMIDIEAGADGAPVIEAAAARRRSEPDP